MSVTMTRIMTDASDPVGIKPSWTRRYLPALHLQAIGIKGNNNKSGRRKYLHIADLQNKIFFKLLN
jgi:hypothetical protein